MDKLVENIVNWAEDKGLLKKEHQLRQFTKVAEEFGEIGAALARKDEEDLEDAIGDTMVTLIILAEQSGLSAKDCLETAYDMIEDRKGETVDGVFIKTEDLK